MQKKIVALAVAGLSTAAFAQTNVTIYGVADVSGQGTNMKQNSSSSMKPAGGAFNLKSNSSLLGFKGTEDLGNGLSALFQVESNVNMTGNSAGGGVANDTSNSPFQSLRDTFVGVSSKYGTGLGGYLSTPYRSALTSFDVMPGATGDGRIETLLSKQRFGANGAAAGTASTQLQSSVRATALAYAMPTLYGFNGSIAYTGSNSNGSSGTVAQVQNGTTSNTAPVQGGLSLNLGWDGYGVGIKGAYQQVKVAPAVQAATATNGLGQYTSYLIGAQYTGIAGLKAAVVYNRNSSGWNANQATGAMKGSNNQVWAGVSYRFGNNEPRLSYATSSDTSGLSNVAGLNQDGGTQWTANWGYYLSKRTQVYGLVSGIKNNANGSFNFASGNSGLVPTGGQSLITYGAGLRTNF